MSVGCLAKCKTWNIIIWIRKIDQIVWKVEWNIGIRTHDLLFDGRKYLKEKKKDSTTSNHLEVVVVVVVGVLKFYTNKLMRLNCDFRLNRMEWHGMAWNRIGSHQIESLLENRRQFRIEMSNVSTYTLEFHHWEMGINAQKLLSLVRWHLGGAGAEWWADGHETTIHIVILQLR